MITQPWLIVVLCLGAVVRLTRLVTEDVLLEPVRRWLDQRRSKPTDENTDWLVYLVNCRWCASIWIAGPVCAAAWAWPHHWFVQIPILALTASLLAGLSGRWE